MTRAEVEHLAFRYEVRLRPDLESGGFVVDIPAFPCVITDGDTPEEAVANAYKGIRMAIDGLLEEGLPLPEPAAVATA